MRQRMRLLAAPKEVHDAIPIIGTSAAEGIAFRHDEQGDEFKIFLAQIAVSAYKGKAAGEKKRTDYILVQDALARWGKKRFYAAVETIKDLMAAGKKADDVQDEDYTPPTEEEPVDMPMEDEPVSDTDEGGLPADLADFPVGLLDDMATPDLAEVVSQYGLPVDLKANYNVRQQRTIIKKAIASMLASRQEARADTAAAKPAAQRPATVDPIVREYLEAIKGFSDSVGAMANSAKVADADKAVAVQITKALTDKDFQAGAKAIFDLAKLTPVHEAIFRYGQLTALAKVRGDINALQAGISEYRRASTK